MELQHVNAKIFVDGELAVDPERLIETFHRWIREPAVEGFMIDVADYRHVPDGPGVMLVGLDCDYAMDHTAGRWGMLYNRKAGLEGSDADRLRQAVRAAAQACQVLENEFDALRFSRQEIEIKINDRALAPNSPETRESFRPQVEAFLKELLGHGEFELEPETEPRSRLGVKVKSGRPFDLAVLAG